MAPDNTRIIEKYKILKRVVDDMCYGVINYDIRSHGCMTFARDGTLYDFLFWDSAEETLSDGVTKSFGTLINRQPTKEYIEANMCDTENYFADTIARVDAPEELVDFMLNGVIPSNTSSIRTKTSIN